MLHDLVARYGPGLVFVNVLASSLGLPVPALPTLIVVGASLALSPGALAPQIILVLILSICASLLGDAAWFSAGRRYGGKTLRTLCKLSLSRDACVKQTERFFGRWGVRVLFVAKFIPGLSMVSVPLAGAMGVPFTTFLRFDAVGAALWASAGLVLGMVFCLQLDWLFAELGLYGGEAGMGLACLLALYIAYRWWRRHTLLTQLETARMSVDDLYGLINHGETPVVFDIRSPEKRQIDPEVIPGAYFADERELEQIVAAFGPDEKLVIYCSCPNEVSAAWMAKRLRELGFHDTVPLLGGLEAWREAGWALAPLDSVRPFPRPALAARAAQAGADELPGFAAPAAGEHAPGRDAAGLGGA